MMDGPDASFFGVAGVARRRSRRPAAAAAPRASGTGGSGTGLLIRAGADSDDDSLEEAARPPGGGPIRVKAMFYAAYVVTQALGGEAEPVAYERYCCGRRRGCKHRFVTAYARRDRSNGDLRLVLVNKLLPGVMEHAGAPHGVQITPPREGLRMPDGAAAPVRSAWWFTLEPPPGGNASAVWGLSWAGMTWDGSPDGHPMRPLRPRLVAPSNGEYFVTLRQSTVGMMVLSARPPHDFTEWREG
jgi:hypothetical protein